VYIARGNHVLYSKRLAAQKDLQVVISTLPRDLFKPFVNELCVATQMDSPLYTDVQLSMVASQTLPTIAILVVPPTIRNIVSYL
jgi:hypothetical protein